MKEMVSDNIKTMNEKVNCIEVKLKEKYDEIDHQERF